MLQTYEKEKISPAYIDKYERYCLSQSNFTQEAARNAHMCTGYLFGWSRAMYDYFKVFTETKPLRDQLQRSREIVQQKEEQLRVKMEELAVVNARIEKLQQMFNEKVQQKDELERKIEECKIQLERAQKLTEGLGDEKIRWTQDIQTLEKNAQFIPGNSALASAMLAYAGPFIQAYRVDLESRWRAKMAELLIPHTDAITMRQFLGNEVKIQQWNIHGLPKDNTSIENGIIIDKSRRWPLMIDPQNQANKFIKNYSKENGDHEVLKVNDPQMMRTLEQSIQFGRWVLLENVGINLDPTLEPILLQQVVTQGNSKTIQIGDKNLSYHDSFRFFITTNLANPHYSPETSVKVCIINFAITEFGLEEQMLAKIVEIEAPNLENRKSEIVRKNAADRKLLIQIEDSILSSLSDQKGDIAEILLNESLIGKLQESKKTASEIKQRVQDSKVTEEEIDKAREGYRPVAKRVSLLFFCILELANIDPMYQYSLQWYINLFVTGVENVPASKLLSERLDNLKSYFTYALYENICRSLFEKHKLLFSFLLTQRILQGDSLIDMQEWRYLLAGPGGEINVKERPEWISENSWLDIYRYIYGARALPALEKFEEFFMANIDQFKTYYDSKTPHTEPIPGQWNETLSQFQKLILLRALRPDKIIPGIQDWVAKNLGEQFIISPPFDLDKCFADSSKFSPLIFVLSAGSDPVQDFMKFAQSKNQRKIDAISLGQGQGEKAAKFIRQQIKDGGWVLLQNCHLSTSWMPELEREVEQIDENTHRDFRLWLTSMPDPAFPCSVLQNGVKMTMEPPKGLRANLMRSYMNLSNAELVDCQKPDEFKKLLFGFCLFHAIIQDRRKFGPIGWNIPYEFTNEDLGVCKKQLKLLLDDYKEIPYKVLQFLGAEINYGGRVTDEKDVRLIKTLIKVYVSPEVLRDSYKFSESGVYYQPPSGTQEQYLEYIQTLPLNPEPEAFGLHSNAEITNAQNETRTLFETLLGIQPRATSGPGKSMDDIICDIANNIQQQTPPAWNIEQISKQYPTDYNESMNTVLVQELIRYNRLLVVMASSLVAVKQALKGLIVMSDELELLAYSLYNNQVPKLWAQKGHLSLKPLSSWITDLKDRINFLNNWINHGTPKVFWISGFHFPQAFITGTMQNYARKHVIAIDKLNFVFKIIDDKLHTDIQEKPEDGCYVYGIYLEGARWDNKKHQITQPKPKELFSDLPLLHLLPVPNKEVASEGIYKCPLYKVVSRAGTLSTTGHSTNFVMEIDLPTKEKEDLWIRAGLAAFLALRY